MCKILYILSCFPWRLVKSVKGGMWRLLCFAFALLCFALALLCFAFALQTSLITRGREKYWWVDCHNQKLVCHIRPPRGWRKARAVQSVGKLSSTCTWMGPGGNARGSFQVFPSQGKASAMRASKWLAPHRRTSHVRKRVAGACPKGVLRWKKLELSPPRHFSHTTLHAPRTPYRLRN